MAAATAAPARTPMAPPSTSSRPSWISRHAGSLFVGGLGLAFAVVGLLLVFVAVPSIRARSAAVDALPVVSPATAAAQPAGTRVLLEARIAPDAPEAFRDFVAFRRREFRGWKEEGGRRREQWDTKEVVTPPLALVDGPHRVVVVNSPYEMSSEPHTWRSSESLEHSLSGPSTQEVVGFRRGDAVTADGVVEGGGPRLGLRLTALAGGGSAVYRESLRESAQVLRIVGLVFAGVGGILFAAGVFSLRRRAA